MYTVPRWYTYICTRQVIRFKWFSNFFKIFIVSLLFHVCRFSAYFAHTFTEDMFYIRDRGSCTRYECYCVTASLLPVKHWQGCCGVGVGRRTSPIVERATAHQRTTQRRRRRRTYVSACAGRTHLRSRINQRSAWAQPHAASLFSHMRIR